MKHRCFLQLALLTLLRLSLNAQNTITDYDGNIYQTVFIGTQVWMQENLKTTHYSNGDTIPNVSDASEWISIDSGAVCIYNNDSSLLATHGHLYNGYTAIDNRNICPSGWHIPTDEDWTILTDFLGGESVSGGKMKEEGTVHWNNPNTGATNESGFTALPSGGRIDTDGSYQYMGEYGGWWSSTLQDASHIYYRNIGYTQNSIGNYNSPIPFGFSVRCIEDPIPDSAKYFGQTPPGKTAEIFAPENISLTDRMETGVAFSSDAKEFYLTIWADTTFKNYCTKYINNTWTEPEEVSFSKGHSLYSIFLLADGNRACFSSNNDIWMAERNVSGWGEPQLLASPFNSDADDSDYIEINNGTVYISSTRSNKANDYGDIWCITPGSDQAELLGSDINTSNTEFAPCLPPDGSYLIFTSDRPGGYGIQDLYISFKNENNEWTSPLNMESSGAEINIPGQHQTYPTLSQDGQYLFFSRHNPNPATVSDIYWVSTSIIDDLKEIALSTSVKVTESTKIQIFPNPATQSIQVKAQGISSDKTNYRIVNMEGKVVKQGKLKSETIDISELHKGIYILNLHTNEGLITKKIVIE